LEEEARRFRAQVSKAETSSILENKVHDFLTKSAVGKKMSFDRNVWCDKCERHIGITLCHGDRRVAIEADGQSRFIKTSSGTYELNGRTRLRNRLLEGADWHVISVRPLNNDFDFDEQKLLENLLVLVE
jgi:hypothetical protein